MGLLDVPSGGVIYLPAFIIIPMLYASLFISPILLLAYFAKNLNKMELFILRILEIAVYVLSFFAFIWFADRVVFEEINFWFAIPAFIIILIGLTMSFKE